ncbi:MAG TPA: isocitrate lyase [Candidatus Binatia bacterium]|jgi:isocitrate lyase
MKGNGKNGNHADAISSTAQSWKTDRRWKGVVRPYKAEDVFRIRGSVPLQHGLKRIAGLGAERLWNLLQGGGYVPALSAMDGIQAVQQVKAGLNAIYCSGWQTAAGANSARKMYPDLSLYPADSVPTLVREINNALLRQDEIDRSEGKNGTHWFAPIVADAEAGFGGNLNAFELMRAMIDAGAAAVHYEDQNSSVKKCGHMGGKVVVPTSEFIQKLVAARLAADAEDVPTLVVARTDANGATLLTSDVDERDRRFITGERTSEGFFVVRAGLDAAIARGLAYAPYADMLWCETSEPDLKEAKTFAEAIRKQFPDKLLAYNCSPSFNWKRKLDDPTIAKFQSELGAMGYKFQFVTLAGFHSMAEAIFRLSMDYLKRGMAAYADLQQREFELEKFGYDAVKHQRSVGAGYFDAIAQIAAGGASSTLALTGSTEDAQFIPAGRGAGHASAAVRKK